MNDAVHVEIPSHKSALSISRPENSNVQVIELLPVGVRTTRADRYLLSVDFSGFFFDDLRDYFRVLLG